MKSGVPVRIARVTAVLCVLTGGVLAPRAWAGDIALLRNGFTIRHEHRATVGERTRLYLDGGTTSFIDVPTADIESFEKDLTPPPPAEPVRVSAPTAARPATDMNQVVNSASATFHLDPDLVNSVIHAESGFNSRAVSRKGAQGLMQLMPDTASKLGVANPFDPQANVRGGSRYLRELLERYNFDLVKALAAYNAGTKAVEHHNGVPPYHETQAYVAKIVHEYNRKKIAQEKQEKKEKQAAARTKAKASSQTPADQATAQPSR